MQNVLNTNEYKVIYENEYFIFYTTGVDHNEVHLDSKPKNIQERYEPEHVLSHKEKIKSPCTYMGFLF